MKKQYLHGENPKIFYADKKTRPRKKPRVHNYIFLQTWDFARDVFLGGLLKNNNVTYE